MQTVGPPAELVQPELGAEFRRLRKQQGLKLAQVAAAAATSITALSYYEKGERNPSPGVEARIRDALGMPVPAVLMPTPPAGDDLIAQLGGCLTTGGWSLGRLSEVLGVTVGEVRRALAELAQRLGPLGMTVLDDGVQCRLRPGPAASETASRLVKPNPIVSTQAQREVLAIAVYLGHATSAKVEEIRGVDSYGHMRALEERGLLQAQYDDEAPGRPKIYWPTTKALEFFGARTLEELRAELKTPEWVIGQPPPSETPEEALRRFEEWADDASGVVTSTTPADS